MSCSISICIRTKDWTMGYWCGCSLLIREGYKATVEWGDGKLHKVTGSSEWIYVTHEYPKPILLYVIRISTEEDDALWGFQDAMHEVDVLDIVAAALPCGFLDFRIWRNWMSAAICIWKGWFVTREGSLR